MIDLDVLPEKPQRVKKPDWLRVKLPTGKNYLNVRHLVDQYKLHTICESGNCPNMGECWGAGTATFMILGNVCTRSCGFCAVRTGLPTELDWDEPLRVATAIKLMDDLQKAGCDVMTIGQYLQPTRNHLEVVEWIHPDVFKHYEEVALTKGFMYVESGPLVRSSYHAEKHVK